MMSRPFAFAFVIGLLAVTCPGGPAVAAVLPDGFQDELVLDGFSAPMSVRFLPDGRILITERSPARVMVVRADGAAVLGLALEIPNVPGDVERGLLSTAVDPQWPVRPYLYAYYNLDVNGSNTITLSRFTGSGDLDGSGDGGLSFGSPLTMIAEIADQCPNHNGGDLRFAPDGTLLLSIGDDENKCAAQALDIPLGKILRMKVDELPASGNIGLGDLVPPDNPFVDRPSATEKLIWAYGLRNPFRMHADPLTGSIFVADVGWTQREEISHVETGGANLGWPYREGNLSIANSVTSCSCWTCDCSESVDFSPQAPIEDYGRTDGRSVVSGGVYRAPSGATRAWPVEYEGDYFYSDFYNGYLRRLKGGGQSWSVAPAVAGQTDPGFWATDLGSGVVSFELAPDGSLYYLNLNTGELRRIVYVAGTPTERTGFGELKGRYRPDDDRP